MELPKKKKSIFAKFFNKNTPLHLMILPGLLILLIFNYLPMFGVVMAFQNYRPARGILGSDWVGLANFRDIMNFPDTGQIVFNTTYIAAVKIVLNLIVPVIFALLINEVRKKWFLKGVQTIIYLPNFISWVILGGVFIDLLSPSSGLINEIVKAFGHKPIFFLGDNEWFRRTIFATDVWKNFGYNTIIYFAALTGIDGSLYEAAQIDGANKWKQIKHITLPGIMPIVVVMTILSLGNILNAGFDQIFNLYNPSVYKTGDILDTFVYRLGFQQAQYSFSTAIGLFKSVISLALTSLSYWFAYKFSDFRIF
ncbi:sugar ABC transporter permease [Vagococcus sp. BWB3-3]|uniref:Sugar ABC transporter permease n=2 Tax=Vagococcus allomyrinae TaxID=2794353 RepID=A0A940PBU9_9ENTE|nr:sugar ABC transporter permease [Vagococcus allomyrinae]